MVSQLVDSISSVAATVRHIESTVDTRDSETYNTVIVFHENEIQQDTHLVDFAPLLNTDKLVSMELECTKSVTVKVLPLF